MPNHIQNKLSVIYSGSEQGKGVVEINRFMSSIGDGKGKASINFNTIIKEPEILEDFQPCCSTVDAVKTAYDLEEVFLMPQKLVELDDRQFEDFLIGCRCYRETGFVYWYDWNLANWKTKWNAYCTPDKRDNPGCVYFQTAWGGVLDLMVILSSQNPQFTIHYCFADEDTGSNVGSFVITNGVVDAKIFNDCSKEAYELAFALWPGRSDDYKLENGSYEYIEEQ